MGVLVRSIWQLSINFLIFLLLFKFCLFICVESVEYQKQIQLDEPDETQPNFKMSNIAHRSRFYTTPFMHNFPQYSNTLFMLPTRNILQNATSNSLTVKEQNTKIQYQICW